jgi:hypothetical protein
MKRYLPGICLLAVSVISARGQEGMYYYGPNSRPVEKKEEAVLLKEVTRRSADTYIIKTRRRRDEGWDRVSRERVRIRPDGDQVVSYRGDSFFPEKIFREMEKAGPAEYLFRETIQERPVREGTTSRILPLRLEGTVTEYHPNGKVKTIAEYRDNQLVSNRNWLPDGTPYIDSVFYSADREPEYKMGDDFFKDYLLQKLRTSRIDLTQIEDRVVIGWVVMETGSIDGVVALEGKARQLNNYLVQAIRQLPGEWEPACLNGSPVRFFMSIPLNFIQKDASFQEVELSTGRLHYSKY